MDYDCHGRNRNYANDAIASTTYLEGITLAIYYTKSTNIEEITGLLWNRIRAEKSKNPLHAPKVIVPNKNMRRWLNLHLAKSYGMVSHIDFSYLEKSLEEYFTRRAGLPWKQGKSTYPSQDEIQKQILEYLISHSQEPEFSSLGKFIQRPSKLFGLSQKLALLFRDYEVNRREWLQVWWEEKKSGSIQKGKSSPNNPKTPPLISDPLHDPSGTFSDNGYYAIEKKIYSDLFLPDKKKPEPRTLTQWLYQETGLMDFGNGKASSKPLNPSPTSDSAPAMHLFCLSQLGYGYLEILDSLAHQDKLDIYFYQFHSANSATEDSIFSHWQKPQTVIERFCQSKSVHPWPSIQLVESIEKKHHGTASAKPSGLSDLKSIIDSQPPLVYFKKSEPEIVHGSPDATVRIWNAPSTYREVEAVFQDILHKMRMDPNLSYEDIAVLVTDMSSYKPAIEWAFDGGSLVEVADSSNPTQTEIRRLTIPYSLTDINAGDSSYLFTAIQEVWKICKRDRLDLQSFKRLLSNPHIFSHLTEETKQEIIACLDHLQVKYEESGREEDSFLISTGIQRARLGAFFTDDVARELFGTPGLVNTSEELATSLTTIWEELLGLRESLLQKCTQQAWTKENLTQISLDFENFFRLQEDDNEFYLFKTWKENLLRWDGFQSHKNGPNSRRDSFELLAYITANSFQAVPFQVGDYLTHGVNVSLLQPMRPIPFRHIYILGLGEGKFPGRTDRSELNLRAQKTLPDRDTTRREVQEALFWETLHSAQETLTLSYVGKDLKTDKTFEPCSTLANLMNELKISKALEIPMHGYSTQYNEFIQNGNEPKQSLVELGLVSYDYSRVWKYSNSETRAKLLSRFTNPEDLAISRNIQTQSATTKNKYFLQEIIRHFRDPLSDYMNRKLQLYKDFDEENLEETDYEIFQLDSLAKSILIREFYPILAEDLANEQTQFTDAIGWQESWTEDRIRIKLEEAFAPHRKTANFPQRVFSQVQIAEFVRAVQHILVLWGTQLWGKNLTFIPHLVLGNTGLRNPGTKQILNSSGNPAQLVVSVGDRKIQILHEWETCFQIADNHYIWVYPKSLDNRINYDSFNGYHAPYWDSHSQIFFALLVARAIGIQLTILNHKSVPEDTESCSIFGDSISMGQTNEKTIDCNQKDALEYLQKIIQSLEKEEMPYFSPMNFLQYVTAKKINDNKFSDEIWNADDTDFQEFLLDDKDTALSELPDPVSLYSGVEGILGKMSLGFAKEFYKPLLQLYPQESNPKAKTQEEPRQTSPQESAPTKAPAKKRKQK